MNPHEFTVTRQCRWPDGELIVEISQGGIDYTNPGALCKHYKGEFETFNSMCSAVEAAMLIAQAWQKDKPDKEIFIATGCTHGATAHFDELPLCEDTYTALRKEAQEFDESIPKCGECGEPLGKTRYGDPNMGEYDCCSEYCAEKRYFSNLEEEPCEI